MTKVANRVAYVAAVFVLIFVLVGGPYAGTAHACSCATAPLKSEIKRSDAVFSGEVRGIDEGETLGGGPLEATGKVTLAVRDSWKGVTVETVDVYGQGDGVNCYNLFEEGEAYLVYASRGEGTDDAPLKNNVCGATKPLTVAEADLRLLGPPAGELPETGGSLPSVILGVSIAVAGLLMSGMIFARQYARGRQP